MADLSLILDIFKKSQGAKHQPGRPGARQSASPPSTPGMARGSMGTMGSRTFQGRDSMASERKEHELMQSPIFKSYLQSKVIATPISNWLQNGLD